ncbi:LANO_0B08834g1_1 [Lachancea nothofagi CBS 11611]|uniref:LANO_0B08834g1_1 n=1 Tax=Lachancea nothofagi CBS 11611 TaxID=1266666 RepID=A0A1G4J112_9SACH|nr:LANO_0B08834g1_1 [Lachancea nothofagi CBS 11611]
MPFIPQDIQDEVFSFSLTSGAPSLLSSPSSFESSINRTLDENFPTESTGYGTVATEDDELFPFDAEPPMITTYYNASTIGDKGPVLKSPAIQEPDIFANAAQDSYRVWLAGV